MIDRSLVAVVAARFKVLGDPTRLTILNALQNGERSVTELVNETGRSQPNVSQHLKELSRAGLVSSRRDGIRILYEIADPYVSKICQAVCSSLEARISGDQKMISKLRQGARRK